MRLLYKIELGIITLLLFLLIPFVIDKYIPSSEEHPSPITGFVSIEMKMQAVDIFVDKSKNFMLTTDNSKPFNLTSFRLSGNVEGEGRVEIVLDNGIGQQLTVFSNTKQRKKSLNLITGLFVGEEDEKPPKAENFGSYSQEEIDSMKEESWLIITPWEGYAADIPGTLGPDELTSPGRFRRQCGDTCYMWMPMGKDKTYKLIVRIDSGTTVTIDEIVYNIDLD